MFPVTLTRRRFVMKKIDNREKKFCNEEIICIMVRFELSVICNVYIGDY